MDETAPYFVDVSVPEAVLLPKEPKAVPLVHPNALGAVWYKAVGGSVTCDNNGCVQKWSPMDGLGEAAFPAKPNDCNSKLFEDGGLLFEREINAGLVVANALIEPTQFSCAIRYSSEYGDARTLLTINPNDQETYLFLSEKDGHISWQDQNDLSGVSVPAPKNGGWILVGFDAGKLSLSVAAEGQKFDRPQVSDTAQDEVLLSFAGVNDVFIGCRSHRKGILKTLGSSRIHDLLIWIDQDLCAGDQAISNAACRYCEDKGTAA